MYLLKNKCFIEYQWQLRIVFSLYKKKKNIIGYLIKIIFFYVQLIIYCYNKILNAMFTFFFYDYYRYNWIHQTICFYDIYKIIVHTLTV